MQKDDLKNAKIEAQINRLFGNITKWLMEIYVLFYLCIFPLSLRDKYYDILAFRFALYWKPTLAYGGIFLILGILYLLCDALYNKGAIRKSFFQRLKSGTQGTGGTVGATDDGARSTDTDGKNGGLKAKKSKSGLVKKIRNLCEALHITSTDIAFTVLILLFAISTAFAEYPYEAFWGDRGRNQGLLLWLMFYLAYILITRFYKYRKWHVYAFMGFSSIVCLWGICNYFMITFRMFEETSDEYRYLFVSSIGNINTYNNFTAIFYGVSSVAFMLSKKKTDQLYTFVMLLIATLAQIMGKSDNALLSTAAVWMVIPLLFIKNWSQICKFLTIMFLFVGSLKATAIIDGTDIPTMNDINPSTLIVLGGKSFMMAIMLLLLLAVIATCIYSFKGAEISEKVIDRLKKAWIGLILFSLTVVIVILVLANNGVYPEIWEPYRNILIFNEEWGTARGLIWKLGMIYWKNDATLFAKIFGYGPDTYYIITMDRFFDLMFQNDYGYFDSAHNEYLEYFITVGIAGLIAYVAFLYVAIREMLGSKEKGSKMIAVGVIAYAVQAVVNIAIPITTPILMVLMFVGIKAKNL